MTTYCVQNNKGMMPIQENSDFSVNFTHTHTQVHRR